MARRCEEETMAGYTLRGLMGEEVGLYPTEADARAVLASTVSPDPEEPDYWSVREVWE